LVTKSPFLGPSGLGCGDFLRLIVKYQTVWYMKKLKK
jgi:hypothetical protein